MSTDSMGGGLADSGDFLTLPLVDIIDSMPQEVIAECIGLCVSRLVELYGYPITIGMMEGVGVILKEKYDTWQQTSGSRN